MPTEARQDLGPVRRVVHRLTGAPERGSTGARERWSAGAPERGSTGASGLRCLRAARQAAPASDFAGVAAAVGLVLVSFDPPEESLEVFAEESPDEPEESPDELEDAAVAAAFWSDRLSVR
jgi:hypothetical protein